jgi:hypothetical protein
VIGKSKERRRTADGFKLFILCGFLINTNVK